MLPDLTARKREFAILGYLYQTEGTPLDKITITNYGMREGYGILPTETSFNDLEHAGYIKQIKNDNKYKLTIKGRKAYNRHLSEKNKGV